ncbi:unnamed protein product [Medioppia subpectinata]|uniref:UDP-glycosyltransferase n=1 Tax=Medioppia subpectinata TaxID=1979941 RepID=A0A7R9KM92_9ACAR|nr:unnamed protein product [Medioppia subpectinata]CAG2106216.1 unnamed protein product [Medioppia subpectinata]
MSSTRLTILFAPLEYHGHVNACHGIAERLRDRGHRIVFAIDSLFEGKLRAHGFEEQLLSLPDHLQDDESEVEFINRNHDLFKADPLTVADKFIAYGFHIFLRNLKAIDAQYRQILAKVRPHLIAIDSYMGSPALIGSGIPFILIYSAAPLMLFNDHRLPPPWSGFGMNSDKTSWTAFRDRFEEMFADVKRDTNAWFAAEGIGQLPASGSNSLLHPESRYLNVYMYPKELDYHSETQSLAPNWKRVDGFVRTTGETFTIPESLAERSGKLVMLSMGSIGCALLDLMVRLTTILAKSEHRFIVTKGPLHDQYELPDNMYGQPFLPQTAVLPMIDLVITHGGNNTVTECFYYGKPMLVMPLFADQLDNAQRIRETGLGLTLNPFFCTEDQLLKTVDTIVNDLSLAEMMALIGERIRSTDDKSVIADIIEDICVNKK